MIKILPKIKKVVWLSLPLLLITLATKVYADNLNIGTINFPWHSSSGTPQDLLLKIINWFLGIIGALAVVAIVYAGILFITSGQNETQVETAKKTLTWAITGLIISALAYLIIHEVITQIK
ncbi:MAG: pilin [Patescibacteria group bacterium]|jgi:amino acid transporter